MRVRLDDLHHGVGDRVAPAHRARARQLQHHRFAVAVDHHAGQAVRFRVHEPHGIAGGQQVRTQRNRALDALVEKRRVDRALLPVPHARDDLRLRIARGNREKLAVAAVHLDGLAGLSDRR